MFFMKGRIIASLCAGAIVAASIGIYLSNPVELSAEDDNIQNVKRVVGAYTSDMLDQNVYRITAATGDSIDENIEKSQIQNRKLAAMSDTVRDHDWTSYDDEYGVRKMPSNFQNFYKALENTAVEYITDSTLDAYYVQSYDLNVSKGIQYDTYGLSRAEAVSVTEWFLYNNPQYYFYESHFLTTESSVYIGIYENAAKGADRVTITNDVFKVVDNWIDSINDDEVTNYQKVLSAHDILCKELSYKKGTFDQSLYSAAIEKSTVCSGYSKAMAIMLNASGIPTTVEISDYHAWNLVKMDDGVYYGIDATWDDALGSYALFGASDTSIRKYDSEKNEHTAVYPWSEYDPMISSSVYTVTDYDKTGIIQTNVQMPGNIQVEFIDDIARVTWDPVSGASGYEIIAGKGSTTIKNNVIRLTGMVQGQTVKFKVRVFVEVNGSKYYSDWNTCNITLPVKQTTTTAVTTTTPAKTTTSVTTAKTTTTKATTKTTTKTTTTTTKKTTSATTTTKKITTTSKTTTKATTTKPNVTNTTSSNLSTPVVSYRKLSSTSIRASWSKVKNATKYKIVIAKDAGFKNILLSQTVKSTQVKISNLKKGTTYYIGITALSDSGSSNRRVITVRLS